MLLKISRKESFQIIVLLTFALIVFFSPSLFTNKMNSPSDLLQLWGLYEKSEISIENGIMSDVIEQFEPWDTFSKQELRHGSFPLWNPYQGAGSPHLANMQSAVLFPLKIFIYLFNAKWGYLFYYFFKLFFIGLFTFLYLREIKIKKNIAFLGSIGYMFAGINVTMLYWPVTNVVFFLPCSLFILEKILHSQDSARTIKLFALYSISLAIAVFGGHPETLFNIGIFISMYYLIRVFIEKINIYKRILHFTIFSFVGLLLSSIVLIPFLEYLFNSAMLIARSSATENTHHVNLGAFILAAIKDYYGNQTFNGFYFGLGNYHMYTGVYVGASIFTLSIFSILYFKDKLIKIYLLLFMYCFALIYGIYPIFNIVTKLPLFKQSGFQVLESCLAFSLVMLCCIYLEKFTNQSERSKAYNKIMIFFSIGTIILIASFVLYNYYLFMKYGIVISRTIIIYQIGLIAGTILLVLFTSFLLTKISENVRQNNLIIYILIILVFVQNGLSSIFYNPSIDQKYFMPDIQVFNDIKRDEGIYRIADIVQGMEYGLYPANRSAIDYNLNDLRNFDAVEIKWYSQILNHFVEGMRSGWMNLYNPDKKFIDYMNVKYVVSKYNIQSEIFEQITENTGVVGEITNNTTIKQKFVSNTNELSGFSILLATFGRLNTSNLDISLKNEKDEVVKHYSLTGNKIKDNSWYDFEFTPINNSEGKIFTIEITSPNGLTGNALTTWKNSNKNIGELYINNELVSGSLCLKLWKETERNNNNYKKISSYNGYYLYENLNMFPRAYPVNRVEYSTNDTTILNYVHNNNVTDLRKSAILFDPGKNETVKYDGTTETNILSYSPKKIVVRVNSNKNGVLILNDSYYPGWKAYINGTPTKIFRANYAFRAIEFPSGNSIVEFKYQPLSFTLGLIISISTFLLLLGILFLKRIKLKGVAQKFKN
ncbi:YfhO family protein [Paenibacillus tyrfis]|uniref:YfhO family protein n=1 Tax=Paenibacillus tyrfis TaxID=1501230 RepID=UPI000B5915B3|nr:YfhO family protein [Paenibacillus tyrfis]